MVRLGLDLFRDDLNVARLLAGFPDERSVKVTLDRPFFCKLHEHAWIYPLVFVFWIVILMKWK